MRLFDPNPVYCLIRGTFRLLFRTYGSWRIHGHEHIPSDGPVIIISNHISYLDPPLMGSAVRRPVAYMAKKELFTGNRLLAWVCTKLESYPVRQNTADREALRLSFDRLDRSWMIGIFPEGHRSESGNLQPFESGFAMIALRSRVPVVPCGFAGTRDMLRPHSKVLRRSPIEVHFGPPVDLSDLYDWECRKQAYDEAAKRCHEAVAALVQTAVAARDARLGRAQPPDQAGSTSS